MTFYLHFLHYFLYSIFSKVENFLDSKLLRLYKAIFSIFWKGDELDRRFKVLTTYIRRTRKSKDVGDSIKLSGAITVFLLGILNYWILISLFNIITVSFSNIGTILLIVSFLIAYVICYCVVFRGDKYLPWFNKFENLSSDRRWVFNSSSVITIVLIIRVLFFTFK